MVIPGRLTGLIKRHQRAIPLRKTAVINKLVHIVCTFSVREQLSVVLEVIQRMMDKVSYEQ